MYEKVIVTNNIIEVYTYEKLNIKDKKLSSKNLEVHQYKLTDLENYKRSQKRRRETIRRLVCTNFKNDSSKFLTLTFKDDIRDVKKANKEFKKFIQRLNYFIQKKDLNFKLKYVAVVEFQDKNRDGVVHYHIICNLPYIPKKFIEDTWGRGFIKINRIDKVDNLGAYVTKYMNKDIDDDRLMGLKAYNCSKNLDRPVEFKNWKSDESNIIDNLKEMYHLDKIKPVYENSYTGLEIGQVTYKQYNLSRV